MTGHYEWLNKLNRCKEKYKIDTSKLKLRIKKQNELIDALKERNKDLKSREMHRLWLKERKEVIEQYKEINKLLDDINDLRKLVLVKERLLVKERSEH